MDKESTSAGQSAAHPFSRLDPSRVLDAGDAPIPGLYCVGEAAGFGGGGASGKRSLEGSFLPGCILTARAAARALTARQA